MRATLLIAGVMLPGACAVGPTAAPPAPGLVAVMAPTDATFFDGLQIFPDTAKRRGLHQLGDTLLVRAYVMFHDDYLQTARLDAKPGELLVTIDNQRVPWNIRLSSSSDHFCEFRIAPLRKGRYRVRVFNTEFVMDTSFVMK